MEIGKVEKITNLKSIQSLSRKKYICLFLLLIIPSLVSTTVNAEPYVDLVSYEYDAQNRLVKAQSGEGIGQSFEHDHVSNRIIESRRDAPIGAPRARSDAYTTIENQILNISVSNGVLSNDTFAENETVAVSAITSPLFGNVILNENGSLTYQPNADYFGSDEFAYQITSDQTGFSSNIVRVSLVILPINPQAIAEPDIVQTNEDTPVLIPVLDNDAKVNSIASVDIPFNGTAQIQGNQILYTPNENYSGPDTFTYVAQGPEGLSQTRVTVTINPDNDPPEAFNIDARISFGDTAVFPILNHVVDPEGDEIQLISVTNSDGTENPAIQIDDNIVTYTPVEFVPTNSDGTVMFEFFRYIVQDSAGNQTLGFLINFTFANAVPVAIDDCYDQSAATGCVTNTEYIINPETPTLLNVLANDFDIAGELLSISSIPLNPIFGTATIQDGRILYTPGQNLNDSEDRFDYEITDSSGNTSRARVYVFIREIDNSGNVPIAVDDCFERLSISPTCGLNNDLLVEYNSENTFDSLLLNDSDPNGEVLRIDDVSNSLLGGSVSVSGNTVIYRSPSDGPIGGFTDAFTYVIENTQSRLTSEATVYVRVKPAENLAPVAVNDSFIVLRNQPRNLNLTANDTDANFDNLRIDPQSLSTPNQGTVSIVSAGVVRYTPLHNADGADIFTYRVLDSENEPSGGEASVMINIRELPPLMPVYKLLLFDQGPQPTDGTATQPPAEGN